MEQVQRYSPTVSGLCAAQVEERRAQGLCNHPPKSGSKKISRIIRDNVCTLFNAINAVLAVALFLVGSYKNMLFMLIVTVNILIGIIQEIRSKKQVEKLSLISMPKAVVMRDGQEQEIPVEQLVLDDVMVLRLGRQVCSDGIVLEGEVEVNEALLTGESDPIIKKVGDHLLSGSFIISGECFALADRVGDDNYAAKIAKSAMEYRKLNSQLMADLGKIIRFDSFIIIPLGLLMLAQNLFVLHVDKVTTVTTVSAALIGMIPEGLLLLTSVSLAVSVVKLARRRTLVQELYCIESLSRVDMLCLDKTGTITMGEMEVSQLLPLETQERLVDAAKRYLGASKDKNPTADAMNEYFAHEDHPAQHLIPFSSSRKYGAAVFAEETIVLGSPEWVAGPNYKAISSKVDDFAKKGLRVIALGVTKEDVADGLPEEGCHLLGLIAIGDKIRREAPDTLAFFEREGVHIKIISGDNPVTVANVAARAGVVNSDKYIDVTGLSREELYDAVEQYTVFGRVTPDQKKEMVRALKKQGHTVAMTGDGVNDVMALKEADCSIAMAAGSDAARQVAHLVLLDNDFSVLPSVVMEGRRVINNVTRTASLYLVKTLFSFLLSVITLVTLGQYPFVPLHFTLISSFGVGIPTFFLALEANRSRIQGRFITTVFRNAVPGALLCVLYVGLARAMSAPLGLTQPGVSTVSFLLVGIITLIILLRTCLPFSKMRAILFGLMAGGFVIASYLSRGILGLVPLRVPTILFVTAAALAVYPLLQLLQRLTGRIVDRIFQEVSHYVKS